MFRKLVGIYPFQESFLDIFSHLLISPFDLSIFCSFSAQKKIKHGEHPQRQRMRVWQRRARKARTLGLSEDEAWPNVYHFSSHIGISSFRRVCNVVTKSNQCPQNGLEK